jgi:hypothetical protein
VRSTDSGGVGGGEAGVSGVSVSVSMAGRRHSQCVCDRCDQPGRLGPSPLGRSERWERPLLEGLLGRVLGQPARARSAAVRHRAAQRYVPRQYPSSRVLYALATIYRGRGAYLTVNSVFINQAPWYIKQRVKTATELARHSSENTLSLSPRPTKTGKGIIRMDDT